MIRCAPCYDGAFRARERSQSSGFTLIEICTVLFILVILLATILPAIQSAFGEQEVRGDAHQLALMVKTAMLQSTDQHRPYALELSGKQLSLHPVGVTPDSATDDDLPETQKSAAPAAPPLENVEMTCQLNQSNQLLVPDPSKADAWISIPSTEWEFREGELCPATRVRLSRGRAWMEISFNALTGNVEDEASYFP